VVVAVLLTAGDQEPVILLFDEEGNDIAPPEHIGLICVNTGVVDGLTVTVIVTEVAHCPAFGVNV
jgi:hypothetical protein